MANMFGALNRFISRLDSDPTAASHHGGNQPSAAHSSNHYGFQILRNTDPALALEPWFDFIIGINGHTIDNPDPNLFATELRNCAGTTISLGVYGGKGGQIREIYVAVPAAGESLGLSLQWSPLSAVEDVWHILDVMPNSPADVAGLLPFSDYVIASPDGVLAGDAGLGQLVEKFIDRPLRLYVYNQEYDVTRMVTLTPAKNWGGEGSLGCVLGYGALHRIPAPYLSEPTQEPGETLFDTGGGENGESYQSAPPGGAEFLVPANMPPAARATSPASGPPSAGRGKKARAHHASPAAGGGGLDDYFAEGEAKSREMDNAPTPKNTGGLPPPPPKSGAAAGPSKAASPPAAKTEEEGEEGDKEEA